MIRGDHFKIEITSNTREHLEMALALAFAEEEPATHYRVEPVRLDSHPSYRDRTTAPALHLFRPYRQDADKAVAVGWTPLPFPLDAEKAARFAWDWLAGAERGPESDIDGSVEPDAFTVRAAPHGVPIIIIPEWSIYSK